MPVYPVPQFVHTFYIINMLEIASSSNSGSGCGHWDDVLHLGFLQSCSDCLHVSWPLGFKQNRSPKGPGKQAATFLFVPKPVLAPSPNQSKK